MLARLRAYHPLDATEATHRQRMLALCEQPGDPLSRAAFAPGHFTASGFVLAPAGDALLLVHHKKLERWLQPGGHLEPGDRDIEQACRRELLEEVGLAGLALEHEGIFDLDIHRIPERRDEPAHRHFDVRFLFRAPSLELRHDSREVREARWFPLAEIDARLSDASVARALGKLARAPGR